MNRWRQTIVPCLQCLSFLQTVWTTYHDLLRADKTSAYIERLADVVDIIFGAAGAEESATSAARRAAGEAIAGAGGRRWGGALAPGPARGNEP